MLSLTINQEWSGGYGAVLTITNNSNVDIYKYKILFKNTSIGWTSNLKVGNGELLQNEWNPPILKGQTATETFGGSGNPPSVSDFEFIQLNPPLVPIDPKVRGLFPDKFFAPYVDILLYPTIDLIKVSKQTNHYFYTLAFITSQGSEPAWGGVIPISQRFFSDVIIELRALGGDVIISFGGANGVELAQSNTDVNVLAQKYQQVIDMYQLTHIDFDIEGASVNEKISIDRRSKAMKILQDNNPNIKIALCLPVLPTGLTNDGLYVVQSALKEGVKVDMVNGMAMDFGDSAWPPSGKMSAAAISVINNMKQQCPTLRLGVTPMIGINDVVSEIFTLEDASILLEFCKSNPVVKMISMWSTTRDNMSEGILKYASPKSSGISQKEFDFMNVFKLYQGSMSSIPIPPVISPPPPAPPVIIPPVPTPIPPVPTQTPPIIIPPSSPIVIDLSTIESFVYKTTENKIYFYKK